MRVRTWPVVGRQAVGGAVEGEFAFGDAVGHSSSDTPEVWAPAVGVRSELLKAERDLAGRAIGIGCKHGGDGGAEVNHFDAERAIAKLPLVDGLALLGRAEDRGSRHDVARSDVRRGGRRHGEVWDRVLIRGGTPSQQVKLYVARQTEDSRLRSHWQRVHALHGGLGARHRTMTHDERTLQTYRELGGGRHWRRPRRHQLRH